MILSVRDSKCPFCKCATRHWSDEGDVKLYGYDCIICGQYFVSPGLGHKLESSPINNELLNCISENIKSNSRDGEVITSWHLLSEEKLPTLASNIAVKRYESFARLPVIHADKPEDLLTLIAGKLDKLHPFDRVKLSLTDLYRLKILNLREGWTWLRELEISGYIHPTFQARKIKDESWSPNNDDMESFEVSITPSGWAKVFDKRRSINSRTVFVAMQFKWSPELEAIRTSFVEEVKSACRDCNYEAIVVSEKEHINQITDEIIANIKSSKFVIADFTFNNRGAYYEAGLAKGLGLPVIHTVMKGHAEDKDDKEKYLHFDIKQINYIEWEEPSKLREQLKNRIKAVIEL